ncbi:MAG: protein-glutamate O-methyltransferase CheR [Alicyclobacillus sp.]|nr:protein-glutamate O-methyltransferase CheR [Alicyclobacillus sp.]
MHEHLVQLAALVQKRCGLNFSKKLVSLENKTRKRLTELGCDYSQYCARLMRDPTEWEHFIELLTVHETYFFREDNHLRELCRTVLQDLRHRQVDPIKIWSAACSTGEEPYSIAMAIAELKDFPLEQVQIVATDIDIRTLNAAKMGWYAKNSFTFRSTPQHYLAKYFDEDGNGYRVKEELRRVVQFAQLNLMDESAIRRQGQFDVIFCRNVLFYFDEVSKEQVIRSLYDQLAWNGYLFMGHAENPGGRFTTIRAPGTFYYKKEAASHGVRGTGGR